jgi:hypothetical protein
MALAGVGVETRHARASASSTMASAMRSLTEPPGLARSDWIQTSAL